MRRFAGSWFPILGCAFVAVAAACGPAGSRVGVAQVRVGGELGWQGQAVVGEVNPLTITVENGTSSVLSATLRAEQRVGSGWRGQVTQRLRAPVLLAPGGRTRFVFPWPVEAGSEPVIVVVEAGGAELARATLSLRLSVEKPVAVVGSLAGPSSGPAMVLAPEDLPEDPLLLGPFSGVWVAPTAVVAAAARDALQAWVAFGGGAVQGLPMPTGIPSLRDDDLRQALRQHGPRPPPVGLLVGGTLLYLIAVGYALVPLSRRSSSWGAVLVLPVFMAVALFYPVLFGLPHDVSSVEYSMSSDKVAQFCLETLAVTSHRGGVWEVRGWWVERVVPGSQRVGRDVSWLWDSAGLRTVVQVDPGQTLFLFRYGTAWLGSGKEETVGPGTLIEERGFAPLLAAVGPLLQEGDRVVLDSTAERRGGVAWHVYRLRWERRG